ncbi:MAG: UDP-N-acetylmuramate--alanine ligase [Micavibrio aeruginosavorus]|uniref:UDP-N-acetylmuramate--alanine ligase n=1 Tax=Micavibrio aeruginosavorus TaxID=349221 RepID=A0A2W5FPT6_9BACT|nr:MAG: UDP-N-acetylmuramate--alanine ligase [Micavibrio aeruginosavorus]
MSKQHKYFFCGIGGSGMLPLAIILQGQGYEIYGSDRSYDQGRTPEKFDYIKSQGIKLSAQDGSGLKNDMILVVSSAIENSIPEVKVALEKNILILKRAELLAQFFNRAKQRIAIAGTSGKSTTTGMLGYILHEMEKNPTVMNGAVFRNFASDDNPYATALSGDKDVFVIEADESDGSIELYNPTISVLNNISLDHKSVEELRMLFGNFIGKAQHAILNIDNEEVRKLWESHVEEAVTYSLSDKTATLWAGDIKTRKDGLDCRINDKFDLSLNVPGRHNLSNALAAICAATALGIDTAKACSILSGFKGVKRRMEIVGSKNGITIIDDFAHNPDKIEASLQTLKEFPGRLLIIFQMHGYGPLKLMRRELIESFRKYLGPEDGVFMPEVLYLGGTADRSYTAQIFVEDLNANGVNANWFSSRDEIIPALAEIAESGDRIVVMGARDDTLPEFARETLKTLSRREKELAVP